VSSVYDFTAKTLTGKDVNLADYRGQVLLIVNTASKCGFTPQYEGLEKLYEDLHPKGFTVLGFPCNQFLFQESGSSEDIAQFCSATYGVSFPMFAKLKVNGKGQHPLYAELTKAEDAKGKAGRVKWNFEKFLINREGQVVGRYRSKTTPDDPTVVSAIESALG
jgi:glutathione peroxidase